MAAEQGAWLCFEDEAGQILRPPKARTWGRRGRTTQVPVSGKGSGRVSVAGLVCVRPGQRSRLIYRTLTVAQIGITHGEHFFDTPHRPLHILELAS